MGKTTVAKHLYKTKVILGRDGESYEVPEHISAFDVTRYPEKYQDYKLDKSGKATI